MAKAGVSDEIEIGPETARLRAEIQACTACKPLVLMVGEMVQRMERIADAHGKFVDRLGGTWGLCVECDHHWPCPTYVWATTERDLLAPWDPTFDGPAL